MKAESTESKVDKVTVGVDVIVGGTGFRFFASHESKEVKKNPSPEPEQKKIEDNPGDSHGNERQYESIR